MILFQYWDAPHQPPDVANWITTLREQNPEYDHQLYSRNEAADYIGVRVGSRERAAFLKCAVPAGQADYFRLCAMVADGGLYLDADSQPLKPLATLIDGIPHALLCTFENALNNSIMLFRDKAHPFMVDCLRLATDNIENQRFNNIVSLAGPSVLNAVYAVINSSERVAVLKAHDYDLHNVRKDWRAAAREIKNAFPELLSVADRLIEPTEDKLNALRCITIFHVFKTLAWVGPEQPIYKQTTRHWLNWRGSIYQ